tara:strand:+ start:141 stop:380 length:240 start_codon:yes stop_codon:yes gene_type:complete
MKKKILQKALAIGKSIVFGIADNVPIINSIKANIQSEIGGSGKFDYVRLATALATLGLIAAFLMGKITIDEVEQLLDII